MENTIHAKEWLDLFDGDALLKVSNLRVEFKTERALVKALNGAMNTNGFSRAYFVSFVYQ